MSNFFPDGYVAGCNPRETDFGSICETFAKAMDPMSDEECRHLLNEGVGETLLAYAKRMLDQARLGSCACESSTGTLHITRDFSGMTGDANPLLNPYSVYRNVKSRGGGSSIDRVLEWLRRKGALTEESWPRSRGLDKAPDELWETEAPKHRIDEFWDINDRVVEVRSSILRLCPVVFGLKRHSVLGIGMKDMMTLIYMNSWGLRPAPWNPIPGMLGFGWLPLKDIEPSYGIFGTRTTTYAGA